MSDEEEDGLDLDVRVNSLADHPAVQDQLRSESNSIINRAESWVLVAAIPHPTRENQVEFHSILSQGPRIPHDQFLQQAIQTLIRVLDLPDAGGDEDEEEEGA